MCIGIGNEHFGTNGTPHAWGTKLRLILLLFLIPTILSDIPVISLNVCHYRIFSQTMYMSAAIYTMSTSVIYVLNTNTRESSEGCYLYIIKPYVTWLFIKFYLSWPLGMLLYIWSHTVIKKIVHYLYNVILISL